MENVILSTLTDEFGGKLLPAKNITYKGVKIG